MEALLLLLGTALAGSLVLVAVSLGLLFDGLNTGVLGLELVDRLDQVALVLVDVSLDLKVELVVQVLVDLLLSAVLLQKTAEDAETTDPEELGGVAGVGGTLSLTQTSVAAQELGGVSLSNAEARGDLHGLTDDNTVLEKLADSLTRVGSSDLVDLIGIKPDSALSASLIHLKRNYSTWSQNRLIGGHTTATRALKQNVQGRKLPGASAT